MNLIRNIDDAVQAYWDAKGAAEHQCAYYAILLFGGVDGFPGSSEFRRVIARFLRRLAIRVEGADKWGDPLPL